MSEDHLFFMQQAIGLARDAAGRGEVPIGAVIVKGDAIIAEGYNLRETTADALAHAELLAIHAACTALHSWRLIDCTLYVTCEPCPMCLGAMINARIPRLVFGCFDPKAGACGSVLDFSHHPGLNHRVDVTSGVLESECRDLLSHFFERLRNKRDLR